MAEEVDPGATDLVSPTGGCLCVASFNMGK